MMRYVQNALVTCVAGLPLVAAADTTTDTFERDHNIGGWTINGNPNIDATGGNPGSWLHNPLADTFYPIVRTNGVSPFVGDFRAMGVTTIAFDAVLIDRDFGNPTGFPMSLLLRDTKNTPGDPSDDDYAYFVGPQVPLIGQGWVHYEFAVPSADRTPVPAGWSGGWAGDLENFRPGVDWNDVITNVDRVEIWWNHPAYFAAFAQWNVGMDNISIITEPVNACVADTDGDGTVGITDFLDLLAAWGTVNPVYDIVPNGNVGIDDFLALLAVWGPCP